MKLITMMEAGKILNVLPQTVSNSIKPDATQKSGKGGPPTTLYYLHRILELKEKKLEKKRKTAERREYILSHIKKPEPADEWFDRIEAEELFPSVKGFLTNNADFRLVTYKKLAIKLYHIDEIEKIAKQDSKELYRKSRKELLEDPFGVMIKPKKQKRKCPRRGPTCLVELEEGQYMCKNCKPENQINENLFDAYEAYGEINVKGI